MGKLREGHKTVETRKMQAENSWETEKVRRVETEFDMLGEMGTKSV